MRETSGQFSAQGLVHIVYQQRQRRRQLQVRVGDEGILICRRNQGLRDDFDGIITPQCSRSLLSRVHEASGSFSRDDAHALTKITDGEPALIAAMVQRRLRLNLVKEVRGDRRFLELACRPVISSAPVR